MAMKENERKTERMKETKTAMKEKRLLQIEE
jgi:hypothetical protein